ncbi:MAG: hypothetical protein LBR65_08875 [Culturomica sp.]|jgi:hypothetical protein|nr:hypothetical protein [Culturomica sp.]
MKRHLFLLNSSILAALCLGIVSCAKDRESPVPAPDEVSVHFRIYMPRLTQVGSRAAGIESAVMRVALLAFGQNGGEGEFLYQYTAEAQNLSQEEDVEADFKATLIASNDSVRLLAVVNYPDGLFNSVTPGTTETAVRNMLTGSFAEATGVPMSGLAELASLSKATGTIRIPMIRSIAKITVETKLRAGTPTFDLEYVQIFRANDLWQFIPDAASVANENGKNGIPTATVASVPAGAIASTMIGTPVVTDSYTNFMTESAANDVPEEAACIVVGGKFNGSETESYYRMDFETEDGTHPMGQVLRNFWYRFTIVKVASKGWATAQEAADNPALKLEAIVLPWNGGEDSGYSFGKDRYVVLSANSMMLDAVVGAMDTLFITTSELPFTITSEYDPTAAPLDTGNPAQTLETDKMLFTLTPLSTQSGQQKWQLTATAKTAELTEDYLNLQATGNLLNIRIPIRRLF